MAKSETKKEKRLREKRRELESSSPEENEETQLPKEKLKRKKRKLANLDLSTSSQIAVEEEENHQHPIGPIPNLKPLVSWNNLDLILSLQNKQLDIQRKVEIAFNFVHSKKLNKLQDHTELRQETTSFLQLIVFLNEWIQSLFSRQQRLELPQSGVVEACFDYRCWEVFNFCLQQFSNLHVPLSYNTNLLRGITSVVKDAIIVLDGKEMVVLSDKLELYSLVLGCAMSLFSSHGRFSNAHMDLWTSLVTSVVGIVQKIYSKGVVSDNVGNILLHLSCLVLDHFANFLRVHPNPKSIFKDFANKVLEPVLSLLVDLREQTVINSSPWRDKLLTAVEDILLNGLFHAAHLEGFLSTHSMKKYNEPSSKKGKKQKDLNESYHKHLFENLERIMAENVKALGGVGEIFHLFLIRLKKQNGVSVLSDETKTLRKFGLSGVLEKINTRYDGHVDAVLENTVATSRLDVETSRSVFDLFVQFMEPLMSSLKRFAQISLEGDTDLSHALSTLKSVNMILSSFMREKIYARTEDDSEGVCINFLKEVYQTVISLSAKIHPHWLSSGKKDYRGPMHMLPLVAKEIILSLGYFLEIEYEVVANDLVTLWLVIIVYSAIDLSLRDRPERCFLTSEILHLGCQLIDVYSELRQVDVPIFALCKAIRLFGFWDKNDEMNCSRFLSCKSSLSIETCVASLATFLSSHEFRLGMSSAIKSIPEGQTSGCIRQLKMDVLESLEWMKLGCSREPTISSGKSNLQSCSMLDLHWQAALLGRALSEIYALILDCSAVTTGNCILVGNNLKDLLTAIRPSLSRLVGKQSETVDEFLFFITGRKVSNEKMHGSKHGLQSVDSTTLSIFLFFFRLYISCRSLFRETISLMPPDSSRKTSAAIGDLYMLYSGKDWLGEIDCIDGGYFSWIVNPSDSLLSNLKSVSEVYLVESECAPLIYVLHVMVLQRLVDLNRQIKAFEFLHERAVQLDGMKLTDDVGLSLYNKEIKKCKKRMSALRKEAEDLTSFLMGSLPLIVKRVKSMSTDVCAISEGKEAEDADEDYTWDLSVCSVTKKLLPNAIWWILCQNTDVWCIHASKNKLKKFLSCLFHNLSSCMSSFEDVVEQTTGRLNQLRKITLHQTSLELLNDTVFHEQSFLRRHLTSRFCHFMEKSALLQFGESFLGDADLKSLPNWPKVLRKLERRLGNLSKGHIAHDEISEVGSISVACISPSVERRKKLTTWRNLLNLLCWIPTVSTNLISFSVCSTYILNLERLVVLSLLDKSGMHEHYELFRLFVHCRKALKCLVMAFCEENTEARQPLTIPVLSESSYSVLWLLKSVSAVVEVLHIFSEEHASRMRYMIFSLMDHTSYAILTLSKYQCGVAVDSILYNEMSETEIPVSNHPADKCNSDPFDTNTQSSENNDAWEFVLVMAETLMEQTQSLLFSLKANLHDAKSQYPFSVGDLNKLSSMVSCIQGYCWGLASVLENLEQKSSGGKGPSTLRLACRSKLNVCVAVYEKFINFCLHLLLVEEHRRSDNLCDTKIFPSSDCKNDSLSSERCLKSGLSGKKIELSSRCEEEQFVETKDDLVSDDDGHESAIHFEANGVKRLGTGKKKLRLGNSEFAINFLSDIDSFEKQQLKKPLLRGLLKGENPELAFSVRQLFIAASAILRLKLLTFCSTPSSSSMVIFISTSQFLLSELAEMIEQPHPFSFIWLDGALKYIEVLGKYISITNPTSSKDVYERLVNIHLKAIGKCISLQGKGATLASHESESSTKTLSDHTKSIKYTLAHGPYNLDEFKARLRMSFKVLINKPFELHLLTVIQALERALVGVHEGCNMIYEINSGGPDGGNVSSAVAAGVDCFDLLLETALGRKLLNLVKKHIQSVVSALFNIVLHLQGPLIFYGKISCSKVDSDPDSGAVILMCIEVLTKISGKHAVFQMDACHVGHSLRVPGTLFQNFSNLNYFEVPTGGLLFSADQDSILAADSRRSVVDQQFSVDLFAACCRLLCTVLRHHRSETAQCIFLLEDSVSVLLHCLETVDADLISRKGYFAWDVQEARKSASFLRRIYEEIRHQKEVLGPYCSHFLSNYISLYSGCGPFKTGIRREIDDALRPGVYALIDACSPDDLQRLHTVLGEGPCRSTLAHLQRDYKLNFKYEGKV